MTSSVRRSVAEAICCPGGCERVKRGYRPEACFCDEDRAGATIAAVLAAIEEPSEAMIAEGGMGAHTQHTENMAQRPGQLYTDNMRWIARGAWRAMLAQLKREIGT